MRLSHCQHARSKLFAVVPLFTSRLDPLAFSGDKRRRSKSTVLCCAQRNIDLRSRNLSIFLGTRNTGLTIGFLLVWRTTFAILRTPTRLVTTPLSLLEPNGSGCACARGMLRCKLACMLPPSSPDPRFASGAFAVAGNEGRNAR